MPADVVSRRLPAFGEIRALQAQLCHIPPIAGEPDSIIVNCMRRFDARQARFEDSLRDMSARLASIESYLATMHRDIARHSGEIETIKARLDRIERHLDLAEGD